jgi:predicted outer membrane repeat protein
MVGWIDRCLLTTILFLLKSSATASNVVVVSDQQGLQLAIESNTTVILSQDIYLTTSISISNVEGFILNGSGFKVDGQQTVSCFTISTNFGVSVFVHDLSVTNGFVYDDSDVGRSAGILMTGGGSLRLFRCFFSRNVANVVRASGGIWMTGGGIVAVGCVFHDNFGYFGGGICSQAAIVVLEDCDFQRNQAYEGGGIYCTEGSVKATGCSFLFSTADFGGGLYSQGASVHIDKCSFIGNIATAQGGGLFVVELPPVPTVVSGCIFVNNTAKLTGGAVFAANPGLSGRSVILRGCSFTGNLAEFDGGAVYAAYTGLNISLSGKLVFERNFCNQHGGAIASYDALLVQTSDSSVNFIENTAGNNVNATAGSGGAVYMTFSSTIKKKIKLHFFDSIFDRNSASLHGGAVVMYFPPGTPLPGMLACSECGKDQQGSTNCLFIEQNSTWRSWLNGCEVRFSNISFTENSAQGNGGAGGAMSITNGDLHIESSIFNSNSARELGGAIYLPAVESVATTTVTMKGAILSGNFVTQGRGNVIFSQSSSQISLFSTMISASSNDPGGSEFDIYCGGEVHWKDGSSLVCPIGRQLLQPVLVEPYINSRFPDWANSSCRSIEGPCSWFLDSCWPPMLQQSFSISCTVCGSGTYSLDSGMLVDGVLHPITCFDNCPYGGDCSLGGADIRSQSGFYGALKRTDPPLQVMFVDCPHGYCSESKDDLSLWNESCSSNRANSVWKMQSRLQHFACRLEVYPQWTV